MQEKRDVRLYPCVRLLESVRAACRVFETKDKVGCDLCANLDPVLQLLFRSLSTVSEDCRISGCISRKVLKNVGAVRIDLGFGGLRRMSCSFRLRIPSLCAVCCVVDAGSLWLTQSRMRTTTFEENSPWLTQAWMSVSMSPYVLDGGDMTD